MTCEQRAVQLGRWKAANASVSGNGQQGFQTPIEEDSFIVDGMGALGTTHTERGLTYFEVALSGHMYVPFPFEQIALIAELWVRVM